MVTPRRGEIWWADLGEPRGSEPGYLRPVLIVQNNSFNRSNLATVIVLALTTNQKHATMPGNILLPGEQTGLAKNSVLSITQLSAIDKAWLTERVGQLPAYVLSEVERSLKLLLDLA